MNHLTVASEHYFQDILNTMIKINKLSLRMKALTRSLQRTSGRSKGQIVTPYRSNYIKRIYRYIDFKRLVLPEEKGFVLCFQYDPNRSANLCLICYPHGLFNYILQPTKLSIGDYVTNLSLTPTNFGDSAFLANLYPGKLIHNIQGKFARSAGCSTILVRKDIDQALVKLKSGELRFFHTSVLASQGSVGNESHFLRNYKYAGVKRHLGKRPRTRPSAMNPVDHPMGGRTRGGSQPTNSKGIITLNRKTVKVIHSYRLYTRRQLKLLRH